MVTTHWYSRVLALVAWASSMGGPPALAHEIRPAIVTISVSELDHYTVAVALNLEALIAGVGPQHQDTNEAPEAVAYNALRALDGEALRDRFKDTAPRWIDGIELEINGTRVVPRLTSTDVPAIGTTSLARISTLHLDGTAPTAITTIRWRYASVFGSSVVRLKQHGRETIEVGWLKDGQPSAVVALTGGSPRSVAQKFIDYVTVGFTHIVPKGLDHILFVLGLALLGTTWRPLLIQVTAFTLAHSITLALGVYGLVSIPATIVEPMIALSIVYVAVENIATPKLHVWRPLIVFGFGLLHGLGFAGVLQEVGLPPEDYVVGLAGFNVGVELGQLFVIAAAWLATGLWFRDKSWYRERIVWPLSALIALIGAYWTLERIWFS
jgi:hypothetical protein